MKRDALGDSNYVMCCQVTAYLEGAAALLGTERMNRDDRTLIEFAVEQLHGLAKVAEKLASDIDAASLEHDAKLLFLIGLGTKEALDRMHVVEGALRSHPGYESPGYLALFHAVTLVRTAINDTGRVAKMLERVRDGRLKVAA